VICHAELFEGRPNSSVPLVYKVDFWGEEIHFLIEKKTKKETRLKEINANVHRIQFPSGVRWNDLAASGPEDVVVVSVVSVMSVVMLSVKAMGIVVALVTDGPEDVVVTVVVSVMAVVSVMVSPVAVVSVMVSPVTVMTVVVAVMVSVVSVSGRPKDIGGSLLPASGILILFGFGFLRFFLLVRVDDVVNVIGDDEQHLSMGEELVQVLGRHLELRNELHHLLGDVLGGSSQLHHGHVFAFFVAESRVPQFVDGLVVGFEGLFGILFLAGQVDVSLSDDLLEVDVLLDEGLHGGVELLDLGVVLRRLSQGDDRLGQFGGMLSDVARDGGRGQGGSGDGAEKDAN